MKRIFAVALLLLCFAPARAQNMTPITPLMKKFDFNHDGTLDPSERQAMWKALQAKNPALFKKFDKNGDGKITGDEEVQAFQAIQRKHAADAAPAPTHASKSSKSHLPASSNPGTTAPEGSDDPPLDK